MLCAVTEDYAGANEAWGLDNQVRELQSRKALLQQLSSGSIVAVRVGFDLKSADSRADRTAFQIRLG